MKFIAGVMPRLDIGKRLARQGRSPLRQQIGLLVAVGEEADGRRVRLVRDDVAHRREVRIAPCVYEQIDLVPAVEAEEEGVVFQSAVDGGGGGFKPAVIAVARNGPPLALPIVDEIRWIGDGEIGEACGLAGENPGAIAVDEMIARR